MKHEHFQTDPNVNRTRKPSVYFCFFFAILISHRLIRHIGSSIHHSLELNSGFIMTSGHPQQIKTYVTKRGSICRYAERPQPTTKGGPDYFLAEEEWSSSDARLPILPCIMHLFTAHTHTHQYMCVCVCVYLAVSLWAILSLYHSVYLTIYLSIYLSYVHYPSIHLHIYIWYFPLYSWMILK